MKSQKTQLTDFVMLPRKIRDDYIHNKLNKNEFDVLIWIWINTNPYNGYFSANYKGLECEFSGKIKYDNIRKIISSLRRAQYIYFPNHKGKAGSFSIYPLGFQLTSGEIQTLTYLENKNIITSASQLPTQLTTQLKPKSGDINHNLNRQISDLTQKLSMRRKRVEITTPYTDTEIETDKLNIDKKLNLTNFENNPRQMSPSKEISVRDFVPNSANEYRVQEIAHELGETDMRFILSCLRKHGIQAIEKAYGIVKESRAGQIKNPRKYFNKVIRRLCL